VLGVIVLAAVAVMAIRKRRELLLPAAWLVVWLLPVLNFWALPPQWVITDRYLFLPSLALPWFILLLVPRRFSVAVLSVLMIVYAALSLRYAAIFKDEPTFVAAMEKAEPTSPLIFSRKGKLLLREGRAAAAEEAYNRAVELDPRDADTLRELGTLEMQRGDFAAAEAHFRHAIAEEPYASRPFKLLVIALARAGQTEHAFALTKESAERWPDDFQVQLMDAAFLALRGDRAAAGKAFERAQRLRPDDPALTGGFDSAVARLAPMLGAPPG